MADQTDPVAELEQTRDPPPRGTFECPICGFDKPHQHDQAEMALRETANKNQRREMRGRAKNRYELDELKKEFLRGPQAYIRKHGSINTFEYSVTVPWFLELLERGQAAESKLASLTSILCTEEGQDVMGRARALVETERRAPGVEWRQGMEDGDIYCTVCGRSTPEDEPHRADECKNNIQADEGYVHDYLLRENVKLDREADSLRAALVAKDAELRKARAFAMADTPWDIRSVLEKLTEAADILLKHHNWTGDGWELIHHARDAAQRALASDYADEDTAPALRKRLAGKDAELARMKERVAELEALRIPCDVCEREWCGGCTTVKGSPKRGTSMSVAEFAKMERP